MVYKKFKMAGEASHTTIDAEAAQLQITGIGIFDALFNNNLRVRKIF